MGRLTRVLSQVSGDMDKSVLEVILTRRKKYTTQEINYGYTPKVHQNSRTTKHSRANEGEDDLTHMQSEKKIIVQTIKEASGACNDQCL